jgi:hypothetical protein
MLKGPEFPAAQLTNIPFCMAANEPWTRYPQRMELNLLQGKVRAHRLHLGQLHQWLSRAAMPLRSGQDIEVPEIMLNINFVCILFSM